MANLNLKSKTKLQLEEIGREYGVELDRRKSKAALVAEVEELLSHVDDCECGKTSDEFGKCDASHTLVDLKSEAIEEDAEENVFKQPSVKLLTDPAGNILTWETKAKAKSVGHKKGGKAVPLGSVWAVKLY